jgi:hypothetical protein
VQLDSAAQRRQENERKIGMMDVVQTRKCKIALEDYDAKRDIENRLFMAQLPASELVVLEEILHSSLQIPLSRLERDLDVPLEQIRHVVQKLEPTGLLKLQADVAIVDKEMRKYFEGLVELFEEDFSPSMDYLQTLLKKVPVHALPNWYSVPRTANSIFESLIERILLTPQLYQRYVQEQLAYEPTLRFIVETVMNSPELAVPAADLRAQLELSAKSFEETMLQMEFQMLGCLVYRQTGGRWEQVVTPFQEWAEYIRHLRASVPAQIAEQNVQPLLKGETPILDGMKDLLQSALRRATPLVRWEGSWAPEDQPNHWGVRQVELVEACGLAELMEGKLVALPAAEAWCSLSVEDRAMGLHRNPLHRPAGLERIQEKFLREAEKSIQRILNSGWVLWEDFLASIVAPLHQDQVIQLKKRGRSWRYQLPEYSESERDFLRELMLHWMFECGMVAVGTVSQGPSAGAPCLRVTEVGRLLFS